MTPQHHVFLSYSRKDTDLMKRIRDDLRAAGLTVWTDEAIAPGTQSWKRAIENAIRNTVCIVCILSPDAATSEWVREELDFAEAQNKQIYLVLARGDKTNAVPFGFSTHQWIDIRQDYNRLYEKLIPTLLKMLDIEPQVERLETLTPPVSQAPLVEESPSIEAPITQPEPILKETPSVSVGIEKHVEVQKTVRMPTLPTQPQPQQDSGRGRMVAIVAFIVVGIFGAIALYANNTSLQNARSSTQTAQIVQTQTRQAVQMQTEQAIQTQTSQFSQTQNALGITATAVVIQTQTMQASEHDDQIAFASGSDIYLINADGSNRIRLTDNQNSGDPAWSPDGSQIAFSLGFDIYIMNADGSNQVNLTNNIATDRSPTWSPDGSQIAFESLRDDDWEIYAMNTDGSNQTNITLGIEPAWSPDGLQIAFERLITITNYEIYIMNADGSNQFYITNNEIWEIEPSWSPDGSQIAFVAAHDGDGEIYVMNTDGSNQLNVTNNSDAYDSNPAWRP